MVVCKILINWFLFLLVKFNGLILLYCLTYKSISRVSGAYDHKMQKGKVLGFWKSYARDNRLIAPESTNWVRSLAPWKEKDVYFYIYMCLWNYVKNKLNRSVMEVLVGLLLGDGHRGRSENKSFITMEQGSPRLWRKGVRCVKTWILYNIPAQIIIICKHDFIFFKVLLKIR